MLANEYIQRVFQAVLSPDFWMELGSRFFFLLIVLVAARIVLAVMQRTVRVVLRRRIIGPRGSSLITVVQGLVWYAIVFLTLIVALSILGVPQAQLLTGLGIGALALALGVQNLIRDMISGIAILMEDIMAVGEEVVIYPNDLRGTVIGMGARVMRIRGPAGQIHQISYSSILSVTNLSRREPPL